jgi:hypothetical protein
MEAFIKTNNSSVFEDEDAKENKTTQKHGSSRLMFQKCGQQFRPEE